MRPPLRALEAIKAYAATWDPEKNANTGPQDVPKVLQFLNDVATTRKLLEEDVGLDYVAQYLANLPS